jgi:peptidylamidoglycolate lyase
MSHRKIISDTGSLAIVFGLLAVAFGIDAQAGKPARKASVSKTSHGHYHLVHGWPVLPDNTILDEVSAVGVDSQDNVLVLQRGGRKWPDSDVLDQGPIAVPTVFLFDGRTGRLLAKWGEKLFALPHGLTVDRQDNVWVTDVAWHQVFKFSHDGRLLLTLGERGKPGDDRSHFNRPTDVAVARDGSFYVSDGYGNSRVLKFAADGEFLFQWGTKGKEPGQFDLPHGIALDAAGRVFVVDRQNARVQVFASNGRYLTQWKGSHFVSPQDIKISSDGTAFVAEGGNDKPPDRTGVLVMHPDGSLVERIGRYGNYDGQFQDPHWLAVGKRGQIYVADFTGRRVQKFVRGKSAG